MEKVGARLARSPFAPIGRHVAATEIGALHRLHVAARARPVRPARPRQRETATPSTTSAPNILALEKRFAFRPARLPLVDRDPRGDAPRAVRGRAVDARPLPRRSCSEAFDVVDPDPSAVFQAITRALDEMRHGRNPLDEGGLVGLFASPEQRVVLDRVQALMSLLEGHGNVVMTELGRRYVAGEERMARVLAPAPQRGRPHRAAAQAVRPRAEDEAVRGRRAVRRRCRRDRRLLDARRRVA